jgi:hypothetical protein
VTRRLAAIPIAFVAILSLVLAACAPAPAPVPALTDPKEIVTKGVTSLADVKTFEFTASFSGNVAAPGLGTFDVSSIKLAGAVDIPNRKAKVSFDAPSLLNSRFEALVVGDTAYYKVAGAIAAALPGSADRFTKVPVPAGTGGTTPITDVPQLVGQLQAALGLLPTPLTKGANEKCGDLDCYHVSTVLTADQLRALDPTSTVDGNVTIDLWTRTSDYRPAKLSATVASGSLGTFGMAIELRYDVSVSIEAPPADQVVQ